MLGALGTSVQKAVFILRYADPQRLADAMYIRRFVRTIVRMIDMRPVDVPKIDIYPEAHPGGGVGLTVYQPIAASYIIFDSWPEHKGATLDVHSCKKFNSHKIAIFLDQQFLGDVETIENNFRLI